MKLAAAPTYAEAKQAYINSLQAEIDRLQEELDRVVGRNGSPATRRTAPKAESGPKPARKRRGRRSSEEVNAQAREMIEYIRSKGREGATGKEITQKFGKILPSIKEFLNSRDAGAKVKTKGAASNTVYFVA
jgi:ElaB/YqjD/DUF883 family membrane-anchored ribosome-binding protein